MSRYFTQFEADISMLDEEEKEMLPLVVEACRVVGGLMLQQWDEDTGKGTFYPSDVTADEVKGAAKENPEILSHFTLVKRDGQGNLYAVPYSEVFKKELQHAASLLEEAAGITKDKTFEKFLRMRADAFLSNDYEPSEEFWIQMEENNLDFHIGPIEPYMDDLLAIKYAFQGNVRVASVKSHYNPEDYIRVVRSLHLSHPLLPRELQKQPDVRVRVDDVVCLSGRHAIVPPVGSNYPGESERVARLGTKIIIYTTNYEAREKKLTHPLLREVIAPELHSNLSDEDLMDASVRLTLLHEITEAILRYPRMVERLKDYYEPVKELHSNIMGMKSAGFHVLKGALKQEQLEAIFLILIARVFSDWIRNKSGGGVIHYLRGSVVAFNFFKESGALRQRDEQVWVNFARLFVANERLSSVLSHLMAEGSRNEAERFFKQYEDHSILDPFQDKLDSIQKAV